MKFLKFFIAFLLEIIVINIVIDFFCSLMYFDREVLVTFGQKMAFLGLLLTFPIVGLISRKAIGPFVEMIFPKEKEEGNE